METEMDIPICSFRKSHIIKEGIFYKIVLICTNVDKHKRTNKHLVIIESPLVCHDCTHYDLFEPACSE
jgi:hypothetical protein